MAHEHAVEYVIPALSMCFEGEYDTNNNHRSGWRRYDWKKAINYVTLGEVRATGGSHMSVGWEEGKWYIHPDSYHIFEPVDNDVIETDDNRFPNINNTPDEIRYWKDIGYKIIQRNNTAFFTPEVQDD